MLVSHVSRIRISNVKGLSCRFLSSSKKHLLVKTDKKNYSSILQCLNSRLHPAKLSGFNLTSYRTLCSKTDTENLESEVDDAPPLEHSQRSHDEHPDVTNRSEQNVEEYRAAKGITVRGKNVPKPITKFSELVLPEHLQQILMEENFKEPTPIQSQGWPVAFNGRDLVGVSQTGSGKTLAYMLPAIIHASKSNTVRKSRDLLLQSPNVLVLGPTRELVQQIHEVSKRFMEACHLKGACVYGGASKVPQLRRLQGAKVCIATPGRLLDYLDNREMTLNNCTYLVLDEADRMLDMGFEPQIRDIVEQIPNDRQTLMWSATWPTEIRTLAEDFLMDYIHITVGNTELVANPNIKQNIYIVEEFDKFKKFYALLKNILDNEQSKVLVFAETKRKVDSLTDSLRDKGVEAWGIHGDCSQNKRDRMLHYFRVTTPSVLIATDVASRGLDISDIHHVINYDFPLNIEDYIHRIGRTARGSNSGESHSFFKPENYGLVRELISVLKESNQEISPELLALSKANVKNFQKPQKRYGGYNSRQSYGRNNYRQSYARNDEDYGRSRSYGRGDNSENYGRSKSYGRNDNSENYGRNRMYRGM